MLEFRSLAVAAAALPSPQPARRSDLAGAWTMNADRCAKVFARRGRATCSRHDGR
jgi:hypothetical protein